MTRILKAAWIAFLAFLPLTSAAAADILYKEKTVAITADWHISSRYHFSVSIDSEDELKNFSEVFLPEDNPTRSIREPFGYYGDGDDPDTPALVAGNRLLLKGLQKGDTVSYGFTIFSTYLGFERTFTDLFRINQNGKVRRARYTVTFPEPTAFQWMLDSESGGNVQRYVQKIPAEQFVWDSAEDSQIPDNVSLRLTTFMSWEEITQHFIELYERIPGLAMDTSLSPRLSVSGMVSENEKIEAVILLLDKSFEYRTYMSETHNLFPDAPSAVFSRKWGDCKDLTLLGASLLRSVGVDAFPVLVGPFDRTKKTLSFPDPFLLQHAVMGIRVGKATRYYDWTVPGGKVDFTGRQVISLGKEPS